MLHITTATAPTFCCVSVAISSTPSTPDGAVAVLMGPLALTMPRGWQADFEEPCPAGEMMTCRTGSWGGR